MKKKTLLKLFLVLLLSAGMCIDLTVVIMQTNLIKKSTLNDCLKDTGFNKAVRTTLVDIVYENTKSYDVAREEAEDIFDDEIVDKTVDKIVNSMENRKDVDFSFLDKPYEKATKLVIGKSVDYGLSEYENTTGKQIKNNSVVKKIGKKFGVTKYIDSIADIKDMIPKGLAGLFKGTIKNKVYDKVYPVAEKLFRENEEEMSTIINNKLKKINKGNKVSVKAKTADVIIKNKVLIISLTTVINLCILILLLVLDKRYIPFAFLLSTIFEILPCLTYERYENKLISKITSKLGKYKDNIINYYIKVSNIMLKDIEICILIFAGMFVITMLMYLFIKKNKMKQAVAG